MYGPKIIVDPTAQEEEAFLNEKVRKQMQETDKHFHARISLLQNSRLKKERSII